MKGVIASLSVFMMMLSFAVAGSSSSIQTDFYIQEPGTTGGYEEDAVPADASSQRSELISKVVYWGLVIIVLALIIKFLKSIGGKKAKPKTSRKKSKKKSRRKK
jgi:hypothetical protein